MKQSFLGFLKKAIFGSDEGKAETQNESQPGPPSGAIKETPGPFFPEKTTLLTKEKSVQKEPHAETSAKEAFSKKKFLKPKTKTKVRVKKTAISPVKKALAKPSKPKIAPKKAKHTAKQAMKKISQTRKAKKIVPALKAKKTESVVKQVWPKTKDSHIRHEKVKQLEQKVSELAAEHNVSRDDVEQATRMETHEVIKQQASLPHLSETEEKIDQAKKSGKGMGHHEIIGLIEEIQKHRILTDFDRIYDEVTEKKRVSCAKLASELKIPKDRVEECAKILEEDKLVEVDYPPMGDEFLQSPGYSEGLKEEKELQKKAKKMAAKKSNAQKVV